MEPNLGRILVERKRHPAPESLSMFCNLVFIISFLVILLKWVSGISAPPAVDQLYCSLNAPMFCTNFLIILIKSFPEISTKHLAAPECWGV